MKKKNQKSKIKIRGESKDPQDSPQASIPVPFQIVLLSQILPTPFFLSRSHLTPTIYHRHFRWPPPPALTPHLADPYIAPSEAAQVSLSLSLSSISEIRFLVWSRSIWVRHCHLLVLFLISPLDFLSSGWCSPVAEEECGCGCCCGVYCGVGLVRAGRIQLPLCHG